MNNYYINVDQVTKTCGLDQYIRKWLPYQILDGKIVKNVQIDSQTTSVSE